jgi:uncharacterized protein (TIGR02145 family)
MKNILFSIVLFFLLVNTIYAQYSEPIDGRSYRTFQVRGYGFFWMAENLSTSKFRNGDNIPQARNAEEWRRAGEKKQPAWCYYNFNPTYDREYGKLYNWFAVNDTRGIAPKGWHIPTISEWEDLIAIFKGRRFAGLYLKTSGWDGRDDGTNISGFSALPGGYCMHTGRSFEMKADGYWWSYSEKDEFNAWFITMNWNDMGVDVQPGGKKIGFSVRCVKD